MSKIDLKQGGYLFRSRRAELQLTLEDVANLTGGAVTTMDVSRIENARTNRPSYEAITAYGLVLGWTPNQIAQKFGMWAGTEDERLTRIAIMLEKLPPETQESFLKMVTASLSTLS